MCMFCKNTSTFQSTTTHVVNYKDCIIVIKNVPCIECDQCGEKYYTDEVAEKLEIIVNMAADGYRLSPLQNLSLCSFSNSFSLPISIHLKSSTVVKTDIYYCVECIFNCIANKTPLVFFCVSDTIVC